MPCDVQGNAEFAKLISTALCGRIEFHECSGERYERAEIVFFGPTPRRKVFSVY
jgi:hypothetical protein